MSAPANNEDLLGIPASKPEPVDLLADITAASAPRPTSVPMTHGEFLPVRVPPPPGRIVVMPPDPTTEKAIKALTQQKIRQAFANLAHNNLDAVQSWLHSVAQDSPARAVELFLQLAEFSLPRLKATEVTVTQNNSTRTYTLEELKRQLEEPG
jgi:hypothetical protein